MKLLQKIVKLFSSSKMSSKECIQLEHEYGCHNYHPLPVVIDSASGIYVKDCEGNHSSTQARPTSTTSQPIRQLTRVTSIPASSTPSSARHRNSPSPQEQSTAACWARQRWKWQLFSVMIRCYLWTPALRPERVQSNLQDVGATWLKKWSPIKLLSYSLREIFGAAPLQPVPVLMIPNVIQISVHSQASISDW